MENSEADKSASFFYLKNLSTGEKDKGNAIDPSDNKKLDTQKFTKNQFRPIW